MNTYLRAALFVAVVFVCGEASAQMYPERRHIRSGNRDYEKGNFVSGEEKYRKAAEKNPDSFGARFNIGDALYREGRMEDAAKVFEELTEDRALTAEQKARVFYNLGNSQFGQQKLQEALESYKSSLRLNPDDMEAKYNLSYVQKLLEQQQNPDDQNNQDDQDQNNDQNQDRNNDQNDENKDDQQDQDDKDDRDGEDDKDDKQQPPPPEKPSPSDDNRSGIDKNAAEAMLDAIQAQEDKTRDKVNAQQAVGVGKSGKNW